MIFNVPLKTLLVISAQHNKSRSASPRSRPSKSFKSCVPCVNVSSNSSIFHRSTASVVAAEAGHVPVIPEVDDEVWLFVGDVSSDPLKVISPYSRAHLGVGDNDVLAGH